MKQLKTVFLFEFTSYLKRKSYVGLTAGLLILIAVVLSWPALSSALGLSSSTENRGTIETADNERAKVALLDETDGFAGDALYYNSADNMYDTFFIQVDMTIDELKAEVDSGVYEQAIILNTPLSYTRIVKNTGLYDSFSSRFTEAMLQSYRQHALQEFGLKSEDAHAILTAEVTDTVITTASGKNQGMNFFYTYVLVFLLYFAVLMYGSFVSSSVATEKSTRAMEILITSAKTRSLLFGKVLGASSAGLLQLLVVVGAASLFFQLNAAYYDSASIITLIFAIPVPMLLYMLLFFVLGFLIYAFLYASLASLVSRMEELSTFIMPVTFLFMIAFIVVMFSMASGNVDNTLMLICSFIPLTSPMAMFTRITMGEVAVWQIVLSVLILIASTAAAGILASMIYKLGVLLYGTPPKPREIIRMLKADREQRV